MVPAASTAASFTAVPPMSIPIAFIRRAFYAGGPRCPAISENAKAVGASEIPASTVLHSAVVSRSPYGPALPSRRQHHRQGEHLWRGVRYPGRAVVHCRDGPLVLLHRRERRQGTAGAVQPRAPRRRAGHRLPLLPHV